MSEDSAMGAGLMKPPAPKLAAPQPDVVVHHLDEDTESLTGSVTAHSIMTSFIRIGFSWKFQDTAEVHSVGRSSQGFHYFKKLLLPHGLSLCSQRKVDDCLSCNVTQYVAPLSPALKGRRLGLLALSLPCVLLQSCENDGV